jgi:hypothetical protein
MMRTVIRKYVSTLKPTQLSTRKKSDSAKGHWMKKKTGLFVYIMDRNWQWIAQHAYQSNKGPV